MENDFSDFVRFRPLTGFVMQAGGSDSLDAARGDLEKRGERARADIKGETMHGDPFAYADPYARDFPIFNPYSGKTVPGMCRDVEVGQGVDQNFFQESQVGMQVPSIVPEVEDGVTDELPRPMVGGLPSTVDFKYGVGQVERLSQAALVASPSNGINRRVFHYEKSLGGVA